jgi:hypothetical protein
VAELDLNPELCSLSWWSLQPLGCVLAEAGCALTGWGQESIKLTGQCPHPWAGIPAPEETAVFPPEHLSRLRGMDMGTHTHTLLGRSSGAACCSPGVICMNQVKKERKQMLLLCPCGYASASITACSLHRIITDPSPWLQELLWSWKRKATANRKSAAGLLGLCWGTQAAPDCKVGLSSRQQGSHCLNSSKAEESTWSQWKGAGTGGWEVKIIEVHCTDSREQYVNPTKNCPKWGWGWESRHRSGEFGHSTLCTCVEISHKVKAFGTINWC